MSVTSHPRLATTQLLRSLGESLHLTGLPPIHSEPFRVASSPLRAAGDSSLVNLPDAVTLDIAKSVQAVPEHSTCCCLAPKGCRLISPRSDV